MVQNELLKMKKIKKDKKKTILAEIVKSENDVVENVSVTVEEINETPTKDFEKKKKKKKKSHTNGTDENDATNQNTKAKGEEEYQPKKKVGAKSNIRSIKKRLEADYDYVTDLLASVHIPRHKTDDVEDDEDDDDDVEDVPEEVKEKMRKEQAGNRAANVDELRERLQKKLE